MRRWTLIGMILLQLLAPVAWAADSHAEAWLGQHMDQTMPDDGAGSFCDHCCHASGHTLGILPGRVLQTKVHAAVDRPAVTVPAASSLRQPPTPPPNP